MDLNQSYFDHQVMLMKADDAGTGTASLAFDGEARALAGRIASFQERMGAPAAIAWKNQSTRLGAALSAAMTARTVAA